VELDALSVARPTLEDVYLELTRSAETHDGEEAEASATPAGAGGGAAVSNLGSRSARSSTPTARSGETPRRRSLTFAFPLMFLVIFTAIFSGTTATAFGEISTSNYYIPRSARSRSSRRRTRNLAISLTFLRGRGDPQAHPGDAAPRVGVHVRADRPRHPAVDPARGHS
jgi:hypothetical protein